MISKVDVARGASDQLGTQLQEAPPVIDCTNEPAPAKSEQGRTAETDLTRGQRHAAHVRIDRVDGVDGVDGARITDSVVVGTVPLPPLCRLTIGAVGVSRRRGCRYRTPVGLAGLRPRVRAARSVTRTARTHWVWSSAWLGGRGRWVG